jgi:hypothetical protein
MTVGSGGRGGGGGPATPAPRPKPRVDDHVCGNASRSANAPFGNRGSSCLGRPGRTVFTVRLPGGRPVPEWLGRLGAVVRHRLLLGGSISGAGLT